MRPRIGQPTLLVYVECMCGQWGTIPEAGILPVCGLCGRRMTPGGGGRDADGVPTFGPLDGDGTFGRRQRGLAFVAVLTSEMGAVGLLGRLRRLLGLVAGGEITLAWDRYEGRGEPRYYTESEIAARLRMGGFPTTAAWEGPPPWERPYVRRDTDDGEVVRGRWLLPAESEESIRESA